MAGSRLRGRWLVVGLYGFVVAFAGFVGVLLGTVGPDNLEPVKLLGLVTIQPTAVGLAVYGMVTLGLILGVPLALVVFVSRRYDLEQAQ